MRRNFYGLCTAIMFIAGQTRATSLADLLSAPEAAKLTIDTVHDYFAPSIDIENFSRDRCFPVLKATPQSTLPLAASFIGTTLHPCSQAQKIVIMKLQLRSADPGRDARALAAQLLAHNSHPCAQTTDPDHFTIAWSDPTRVLAVLEGADQGPGYTITLFSRAALTPAQDEADTQAYKLWNSAAPPSCQKSQK